jgi:hypothetical protein
VISIALIEKKGEKQDIDGSDGICDLPYIIDNLNIDNFPFANEIKFVKEISSNETTFLNPTPTETEVTYSKQTQEFLVYLIIIIISIALIVLIIKKFRKR